MSGEAILAAVCISFTLLFFGVALWLVNPKHDERLQKFVGWLWETNHPKPKKLKRY